MAAAQVIEIKDAESEEAAGAVASIAQANRVFGICISTLVRQPDERHGANGSHCAWFGGIAAHNALGMAALGGGGGGAVVLKHDGWSNGRPRYITATGGHCLEYKPDCNCGAGFFQSMWVVRRTDPLSCDPEHPDSIDDDQPRAYFATTSAVPTGRETGWRYLDFFLPKLQSVTCHGHPTINQRSSTEARWVSEWLGRPGI